MIRSILAVATISLISLFEFSSTARAVEIEFERDSNLPIVDINVAIKTGAVSDPKGQSGVTNFMGEMLLRGTKSRTKEQIDLELDQMGAHLDVEVRAESTIFRGSVLSSQLDRYLRLLTDVLTQPSFPETEIAKLKKEIISGILDELGRDQSLASRRFTRFLFEGHPYGNPILGRVKDIEALTQAQLAAQYDKLVREKQLLVVGTGDSSEKQISQWAEQLALSRPGGEKAKVVDAPKQSDKRRLLIVDKPDRTQVQMIAGQIGVLMTDPNYFPLYVGNYVFGGGSFSSILMKEIRVKRGWSYGAGSNFRHGLRPRSWQFSLFPKSGDAPPALAESLRLVEALKKDGITQPDFDFATQSLINSAGFSFNTPKKRVENILLERCLNLPDGFMRSYAERIGKVSLSDVNTSLAQFLKPGQLSILVLGTAKDLKAPLAKAAGVPESEVQVVPYTQD